MGRIFNQRKRTPQFNGMSPMLLSEVMRALEQSRLALEDARPVVDHESLDLTLIDRALQTIKDLTPKLSR
jgi:hypothetical protein